jgi:hypothetical protein
LINPWDQGTRFGIQLVYIAWKARFQAIVLQARVLHFRVVLLFVFVLEITFLAPKSAHIKSPKECTRTLWVYLRTLWNYMPFTWEFARSFSFVYLQNLTFFGIASTHVRNSNIKLIFTGGTPQRSKTKNLKFRKPEKSGRRSWHKRIKCKKTNESPECRVSIKISKQICFVLLR